MNMLTAAIILAVFLANAFFMFCACRAASFSDRQDEALFKKWLKTHQKEVES